MNKKLNVFHHGCRSIAQAISIANFPTIRPNVNGVGFYCSEDIEVARLYGSYIITIYTEQDADVTRPICLDPNISVADQMMAGMESVFVTEASAIALFVDAHMCVLTQGDVILRDLP